jgi:Icc-related predicted phosphoesterase
VGLRQALWLKDAFAPWVAELDVGRVIVCWGNHDYVGELPERELPPIGAEVVTDREIEVSGLRLYATPWTFTSPGVWAFDIPPATLERYMQAIPGGVDILVTHGPPLGVLDRVVTGDRVGSRALAEAVARVRPRLHVFGHIHEARGQEGTSHNVAFVDEQYRPYRLPLVEIDL